MGKCNHEWTNGQRYGVDDQYSLMSCAHCKATRHIDWVNGFDDIIESKGDGNYMVNGKLFVEISGQLIPLSEVEGTNHD